MGIGGPLVRGGPIPPQPAQHGAQLRTAGPARPLGPCPGRHLRGPGPARPRLLGAAAAMAGLEPLYAWARAAISRPQDALICGVHWELVRHGYRCLGAGDQVRAGPGPAGLRRRGGRVGRGQAPAFPSAARRRRSAEPEARCRGVGEPCGARGFGGTRGSAGSEESQCCWGGPEQGSAVVGLQGTRCWGWGGVSAWGQCDSRNGAGAVLGGSWCWGGGTPSQKVGVQCSVGGKCGARESPCWEPGVVLGSVVRMPGVGLGGNGGGARALSWERNPPVLEEGTVWDSPPWQHHCGAGRNRTIAFRPAADSSVLCWGAEVPGREEHHPSV